MSRIASLKRSEKGQSLVEFALILPVFLAIVFGIIEFGFVVLDDVSLSNAVRDGARVGSLKGSSGAAAVSQTQSSASGLVSCTLQTPTATYAGNPEQVTVQASCTYSPVTPLGSLVQGLNLNMTLSHSVKMRVEQ